MPVMDFLMDSSAIRLSPRALEQADRFDQYHAHLRQWRQNKITDAELAALREGDKEFDCWLWRMGVR